MPRKGENIYKRKDGRWEGRYKTAHSVKYRSVYGKSYSEVKAKLNELKKAVPNSANSGNIKVRQLFEEWLHAIKFRVKESTFANYSMKAEKHILPYFGDLGYDKLTVSTVHEFIDMKLQTGLSAKYVSDIIVVFKSMTKYISRIHGFGNPLLNVIMPKARKKETVTLSSPHQKKLNVHSSIERKTECMEKINMEI